MPFGCACSSICKKIYVNRGKQRFPTAHKWIIAFFLPTFLFLSHSLSECRYQNEIPKKYNNNWGMRKEKKSIKKNSPFFHAVEPPPTFDCFSFHHRSLVTATLLFHSLHLIYISSCALFFCCCCCCFISWVLCLSFFFLVSVSLVTSAFLSLVFYFHFSRFDINYTFSS